MIIMSKEELIEVQGKVIDNLPQGKFKVELDGGTHSSCPCFW